MDRHYLAPLFEPRAVVVLGSTAAPLLDAQLRTALANATCPVEWLTLSPGVAHALPERPFDLAILAQPPALLSQALDEAARIRARAVVALANGVDDAAAQALRAQAARLGIHLLGPNSLGLQRPRLKLNASGIATYQHEGSIALVSQSGSLASAIADWGAGNRVGFSAIVSVGPASGVDVAQVLDFLSSDIHTSSVVLYLEGIRSARTFMSALRAAATAKPVIVLKAGRRSAGSRAAITHSGALVGREAVFRAALRRAGAVQVSYFIQLFSAARCLSARYRPCGNRLAIVSNGGGPGVLAADWAGDLGIEIAPPDRALVDKLKQALPHLTHIDNPLDLGEEASAVHFQAAIEVFESDPNIDGALILASPKNAIEDEALTDALIATGTQTEKPLVACLMGEARMRDARRRLEEARLPAFRTPETAVDAFSNIAAFHVNQQLRLQTPAPLGDDKAPSIEGARMLIESVLAERRAVLTEMESKALLAAFDIPVTKTIVARAPTEAIVVAEQLGFPVALKINSPDITHKSEVGGVVLNVADAQELRTAYVNLLAAVKQSRPDAKLDGVAIQTMSVKRHGRELHIGAFTDPLFGPLIVFGAGGAQVELIRDRALELPPLNRFLAQRLIARTRVARSLGNMRGLPAIDMAALEAVLLRVSEMVCELPWLKELDINPLIVDESGAIAVDARIVVGDAPPTSGDRYAHMAIVPYPTYLTQECVLADGGVYTIRPIRPEDADALQAFVRGLSDEARYFRFISAITELTPRMLARYTQIDYDQDLAMVCVAPDESAPTQNGKAAQRIIGVARYHRNPDGESCEFAIVVADAMQGKGLGSRLMHTVIDAARDKGLKMMEGFVLANNPGMLKLMHGLGFHVEADPEDASMRLVKLVL